MKQYLSVLIAGAALLCLLMAYGCGTTDETTARTTPRETTAQTTLSTTETTKNETTKEHTTTETEPLLTNPETSDIIDPEMTLPDIDNPITDIEPNIPESGVGDNGGIGDMFDSDMNGSGEMGAPNGDTGLGGDRGARGRNRTK